MKAFLFLIIALLYSCRQSVEVKDGPGGIQINNIDVNLSHLNEVEWHVGVPRRTKTVTQSFTFLIDLPKISESDMDLIMKHRKTDSWILRLIFEQGGKVQDLGSMYTPFKNAHTASRGQISSTSPSSASMKVYYAAAYASERFRAMSCPPFGHNRRIKKMSIMGEETPIQLELNNSSPYSEKSQLNDLAPSSFNAGLNLVGNYYVEIAAYNSQDKMINSHFVRIPEHIEVKSEEQLHIHGCEGVHQELR